MFWQNNCKQAACVNMHKFICRNQSTYVFDSEYYHFRVINHRAQGPQPWWRQGHHLRTGCTSRRVLPWRH